MKQREKNCDICITDFILDNYQEKQLFYEPLHPTNILIFEMARRVLSYIGYEMDEEIAYSANHLNSREVFIYECVRKTLGLKYEQNFIKRYFGTHWDGHPVSLEEYAEGYYRVLHVLEMENDKKKEDGV